MILSQQTHLTQLITLFDLMAFIIYISFNLIIIVFFVFCFSRTYLYLSATDLLSLTSQVKNSKDFGQMFSIKNGFTNIPVAPRPSHTLSVRDKYILHASFPGNYFYKIGTRKLDNVAYHSKFIHDCIRLSNSFCSGKDISFHTCKALKASDVLAPLENK